MALLHEEDAHALEVLHVAVDRRGPQTRNAILQALGLDFAGTCVLLLQPGARDLLVVLLGCVRLVGGFLGRYLAGLGQVAFWQARRHFLGRFQLRINDLVEGLVTKNSREEATGRTDVRR